MTTEFEAYEEEATLIAEQNLQETKKELIQLKRNQSYEFVYANNEENFEFDLDQYNPEHGFNPYDLIHNPWDCYALLDFFGLLNEKQELGFRRLIADHTSAPAEFIDFETIQFLDEDDHKIVDNIHWQYYYQDIKVLLTYDLPYYSAYRIAEQITDCQFIGISIYSNDIWSMINYNLKTGECDLNCWYRY